MSTPAHAYESYSVPALFGPLAELLVEAARPQAGDRLVDVACGTGVVLRTAAQHVGSQGRLTGIDVNPGMVTVAREVTRQEGLTPELLKAPAEALPVPDASADLVLCGAGLMFFSDRVAALSEMRRILAPGGRVAVSVLQDLSHHPFYEALFGEIRTHLGIADLVSPFALGDETGLRRLFDVAGLAAVEVHQRSFTARFAQPDRFLSAAVNTAAAGIPELQRLDDAGRTELLDAISEQMQPLVQEATVDDHVVLPMHAHIAYARRLGAPGRPAGAVGPAPHERLASST